MHLLTLAQCDGFEFANLAREGSTKIETESGVFTLYPDFGFQLLSPSGKSFNFYVELDNGTERVRSKQAVESLERKIRGYDAHQSQFEAFCPDRYVVLFVTTRSSARVDHILDAIRSVTLNHQRRAFLVASIQAVLGARSIHDSVFLDLNGPVPLLSPT